MIICSPFVFCIHILSTHKHRNWLLFLPLMVFAKMTMTISRSNAKKIQTNGQHRDIHNSIGEIFDFVVVLLLQLSISLPYSPLSPQVASKRTSMPVCRSYCGLDGGVISSPSPEPGSPFVLFSFFHFMRRFWNQILICRSVRHNA